MSAQEATIIEDGRSSTPSVRRLGSLNGRATTQARIMKALLEIVYEDGYPAATVTAVLGRARVSAKTFYEYFETAEDCLLATFDDCLVELQAFIAPAYERNGRWSQRMRAAVEAALCFLDSNRPIAALLLIEAPKAGPAVRERRARELQIVRLILDAGRSSETSASTRPPELASEVLLEGLLATVAVRLRTPERTDLLTLLNPIMRVITHCYFDVDAVHDEAGITDATTVRAPRSTRNHLLAAVPMRMTYRTFRVLTAIARQPGSRNRDVADAAGISDPGQMSRLLAKLASHDLIRNEGDHGPWAPKGWYLTSRGEQIERAVRHEAALPPNQPSARHVAVLAAQLNADGATA